MTPTTSERDAFEAWMDADWPQWRVLAAKSTVGHLWRGWQAALTRQEAQQECPKCGGTGGERWHEADGSENGARCDACDGFGTQQEARKGALDELARENERLGLSYDDAPQQEAQGAVADFDAWFAAQDAGQSWLELVKAAYSANTTPPAPVPAEAQGAVAWMMELAKEIKANAEDHPGDYISKFALLWADILAAHAISATPPAPVDVRVVDAAMVERVAKAIFEDQCPLDLWGTPMEDAERESWRDCARLAIRALLDGQPAGVDDATVERAIRAFDLASTDKAMDVSGWMRAALQAALGGGGGRG